MCRSTFSTITWKHLLDLFVGYFEICSWGMTSPARDCSYTPRFRMLHYLHTNTVFPGRDKQQQQQQQTQTGKTSIVAEGDQ